MDTITEQAKTDMNTVDTPEGSPRQRANKGDLKPLSFYRHMLKPHFTTEDFKANPRRLVWGLCYFVLALASVALILSSAFWPLKIIGTLILGCCWCGTGFLAHEILHGSVVKKKGLQDFFAFLCFVPWGISPTFWRYWHNHLHHGYTQQPLRDPDAFPILRLFRQSKLSKFLYRLTPGSRGLLSPFYLFYFFSFNLTLAQLYFRFQGRHGKELNQWKVSGELLAMAVIWVAILTHINLAQFIFMVVLVVPIQNYLAMSYIVTNHNVMPLTPVNDPFANSLTVTTHPWIESFFLNFGYHVEHHLFADMSSSNYKRVHALLKEKFPAQFKFLPKGKALSMIRNTPRIYKDSKTLIHPASGDIYPTL